MTVWIVHREPAVRAALQRLAGEADVQTGAPRLETFGDEGRTPRAVVLGLEGDLRPELVFARRLLARHPDTGLVLVHPRGREAEVAARFEGVAAEHLAFPPDALALRAALARAAAPRRGGSLAARRRRALLEERFERWFADLPLPSPGAPAWRRARALVRGEPGSGRMLLARALHERGAREPGAFVHVPCDAALGLAGLVQTLESQTPSDGAGCTICLEGLEALAAPLQRALRSWIELGPPGRALPLVRVRWIAVADLRGPALDPGLVHTLADLSFRIPPLRERRDAVAPFVRATAARWATRAGVAARGFEGEALTRLREDPWPGNLRELEAVVVRCLAAGGEAPVTRDEVEAQLTACDEESPLPGAEREATTGGPMPAAAGRRPTLPELHEPEAPAPGTTRAAAPGAAAREPASEPEAAATGLPALPELARSLAHELRNPLTGIRTFAALLPEHFQDAEFRDGFRTLVEEDVGRMEETLDRLQAFATLGPRAPGPVDVAALLEELLEQRRPEIQRRRLLVLQELDAARPFVQGDAARLRFAFEALLDRALAWVEDRADLYVASRHHPAGPEGGPTLRVLLRFHHPGGGAPAAPGADAEARREVAPRENAVELALAEAALRGEGGRLTVDAAGEETVLLLDLPAPPGGTAPERPGAADASPAAGPAAG
jgi:DNA-binding NtrC family response regulator